MEPSQTYREELIAVDGLHHGNGVNYRDSIQKMLDKKLSLLFRALYGFICLVGAAATLYFASWVFKKQFGDEFAAFIVRVICGAGMVFSGILTFFAGWSAITAKVKGRFYPGFIFSSAVVVLCYFVVALCYMMFIFPVMMELQNSSETPFFYISMIGIQLMLLGFFAMVTFALVMIFLFLGDLKFTNQKKLLQIEYKLAMLNKTSDNDAKSKKGV